MWRDDPSLGFSTRLVPTCVLYSKTVAARAVLPGAPRATRGQQKLRGLPRISRRPWTLVGCLQVLLCPPPLKCRHPANACFLPPRMQRVEEQRTRALVPSRCTEPLRAGYSPSANLFPTSQGGPETGSPSQCCEDETSEAEV